MATIDWFSRILAQLAVAPGAIGAGNVTADSDAGRLMASIGNAVQAVVENDLARTMRPDIYTEAIDGNGRRSLYLAQDPIQSVSAITMNGTAVVYGLRTTIPTPRVVIASDQSSIEFTDGCSVWTKGVANIIVTYTAGLTALDTEALEIACAQWAAFLYRNRENLNLSSVQRGREGTTSIRHTKPDFVDAAMIGLNRMHFP